MSFADLIYTSHRDHQVRQDLAGQKDTSRASRTGRVRRTAGASRWSGGK